MNTYEIVTNQILSLLEQNENPWTKPWVSRSLSHQKNLNSLRAYTGLNALILALQNKDSDFWLTFKQADALGFRIRRGEKATPVIGWFKSKNAVEVENDDGEMETRSTGGLRAKFFNVFNLSQCDAVPESILQKTKRPEIQLFDDTTRPEIDSLIENTKAQIKFGFEQAAYYPKRDEIKMPDRNRFQKLSEFYSTIFHELGHWTGHASRLKRAEVGKSALFNSKAYSQEELCAEMASVYVCAALSVSSDSTTRNSVAYLQGWLKFLKGNPKAFAIACQQGQKASDFILKATP